MKTGMRRPEPSKTKAQFERLLGQLCMQFAQLETALRCAVGFLISDDVCIGHIVTAELSVKARIALLASLYRHKEKNPKLLEQFEMFLHRASDVDDKRNRLVHSIYWPCFRDSGQLTKLKTTAKQKRGLLHAIEPISPEDLGKTVQAVSALLEELDQIMLSISDDYNDYGVRFYSCY